MTGSTPRRIAPILLQWIVLLGAAALFILGLRLMLTYIPFASDWERYFQPTARDWLLGKLTLYGEPDQITGFWNFPWFLWPLLPLAVWPVWLGWGVILIGTFLAMAWQTRGYEKWWLVFVSPLIVDLVVNGQVEIIPLLGIALGWMAGNRPYLLGVGLVLMAAKPQACLLVALWLLYHHRQRIRPLLVPIAVFLVSLAIHGWDWWLRWATGPSILQLMSNINNSTPWRSIGLWMAPVAIALGLWSLRLPRTRRNLGALVTTGALVAPYMSSHSLVLVLTFGLLPLGPAWALAGWIASFTVLLRGWLGKPAAHLDFLIAAVLMIGYLLHADRGTGHPAKEAQP
jgi:hypothetical protein